MNNTTDKKRASAVWVLNAVAAAAVMHFAAQPDQALAWIKAVDNVRPLVERSGRQPTLQDLRALPEWSLQTVAKAAAELPFPTPTSQAALQLVTEFERRRARRARRAGKGAL